MLVTKKGFTLIECLVALFIVAILLATAVKAIGVATSSIKDNYNKEVGSWIASNAYYELKAKQIYPELGENKNTIEAYNNKYVITTKTIDTGNTYFRKIDISVATEDKPNYVLFHTVYFFSQY